MRILQARLPASSTTPIGALHSPERARRWAEEHVSLDASVRSYETLYESLLR